jgi:hypothetical protein
MAASDPLRSPQAPRFNATCWDGDACAHEFYSAHVFARKAVEVIQQAAIMMPEWCAVPAIY